MALVVRTLANDADVQFGTILAVTIIMPGPVVTNLMT